MLGCRAGGARKLRTRPSVNKMNHLETFQDYRPLLFSIAYRMLGAVTEAEDVLQEAYLRWRGQSLEAVREPKYFLTTVVTRLCLNELSSARAQRETYLGPWLPEPVETGDRPELENPAHRVVLYDSLSIAFLVLLETLSPAERAVFLLHDVFAYKYDEVAAILEKSESACRQLGSRARQHIEANRPRFEATTEAHDQLLHHFIKTVETGEIEPFLQLLADDVTLVPDGGGERGAAIRVLHGRDSVASFIQGVRRQEPQGGQARRARDLRRRAIVARTPDARPYYALFLYVQDGAIRLMQVIAGRKLAGIDSGGGRRE